MRRWAAVRVSTAWRTSGLRGGQAAQVEHRGVQLGEHLVVQHAASLPFQHARLRHALAQQLQRETRHLRTGQHIQQALAGRPGPARSPPRCRGLRLSFSPRKSTPATRPRPALHSGHAPGQAQLPGSPAGRQRAARGEARPPAFQGGTGEVRARRIRPAGDRPGWRAARRGPAPRRARRGFRGRGRRRALGRLVSDTVQRPPARVDQLAVQVLAGDKRRRRAMNVFALGVGTPGGIGSKKTRPAARRAGSCRPGAGPTPAAKAASAPKPPARITVLRHCAVEAVARQRAGR